MPGGYCSTCSAKRCSWMVARELCAWGLDLVPCFRDPRTGGDAMNDAEFVEAVRTKPITEVLGVRCLILAIGGRDRLVALARPPLADPARGRGAGGGGGDGGGRGGP